MRVRMDEAADALYIRLEESPIVESEEVSPGVILDFDEAGRVVGIEMLVIVFLFQWQFGYFWTVRGYEFALLWALLCIAIFFKGGGRYSIDRIIGKEF